MEDATPNDCKRIIIVGAGGFGREVLQWACHAWIEHVSKIVGFLSADADKLDGYVPTLPILGSPAAFQPQPSDALVLAIGIPDVRRRVAVSLLARGGRFLTLIHPTAIVAPSASIGLGSILYPYAIASASTSLGRFTLLNYHASLGHEASTGEFSVLSPYATLGGGASVGVDVFMGLHASVAPGRAVGASSKVSANSACLADVPAGSIVFAVPGRAMRRIDTNHGPGDGPGPATRE